MKGAFALPVVLFAISIGGALAVGATFVTRQLAAGSRASNRALELEPKASEALITAIMTWDPEVRESQPVGTVAPYQAQPGASLVNTWITRTTGRHYWIVAEAATVSKPLLYRSLGVLIRVDSGRARLVSKRAWSDLP